MSSLCTTARQLQLHHLRRFLPTSGTTPSDPVAIHDSQIVPTNHLPGVANRLRAEKKKPARCCKGIRHAHIYAGGKQFTTRWVRQWQLRNINAPPNTRQQLRSRPIAKSLRLKCRALPRARVPQNEGLPLATGLCNCAHAQKCKLPAYACMRMYLPLPRCQQLGRAHGHANESSARMPPAATCILPTYLLPTPANCAGGLAAL